MDKYSRTIKLRLAWWCVWWTFCVLLLLLRLFDVIDFLRYPDFHSTLSICVTAFWICILSLVVPNMRPSKARLLKKDLEKDPDNIYARAMVLEIAINKHKKEARKKKEDDDLKEKIKVMEDEIKG